MKRDVKVGLFVAGVVCSVAALLLGGGMAGRSRPPTAPLRLSSRSDTRVALPAELVESVLPPAGAERLADEIENFSREDPFAEGMSIGVDAADAAELPETTPEALADEELTETVETLGNASVIAEWPASLLEAGPSASGPVASFGEEVDIVELSVEDLLAREAEAAGTPLQAPAQLVEVGSGAGGVAFQAPALRIAPPARGIAVPPPAKHVYIMKPGDSFWRVSKKIFGAGKYFLDIRRANPDVKPRKLRPGDKIAIPEISGASMRKDLLADPAELEANRRPRIYLVRDKTHVVQPGEILEDIALKYYGYKHKWPHIRKANPDLDPRRIRPGDKIVVPALTE